MADRPSGIVGRGMAPMLLPGSLDGNHFRHVPRIAFLVFAGYYLGARLGLALTFPPLPTSVLWPPNTVLFAAMMLLPPRMWGWVIAAALPAHLISELQGGIPLAMVMSWFASNVTEALIGAGAVRALAGFSNPFGTARGVMMFLVAVAVATVLSSFLDAAFVRMNAWGTAGYWKLWSSRLLSNTTANLVFVPAIVTWALARREPKARTDMRRLDEAFLLYIGLAMVVLVLLATDLAVNAPAAQVCLPLPFMLWAAFRFGPRGASASFAAVAIATIWGAGHGIGALAARSPIENAHSVQLYLLCLGPTLLCIAAVIEERRRTEASLRLSDKRFRLVLQATRDIVYERDMETGSLWWSHGGPGHFGYSRQEGVRTFASFAALIHDEDRERVLAHHEHALAAGWPLWEAEFRLRRADGFYSQVHEQGFIVRDAEGRALQMIATITDVTERSDTEELNHRLAHAARLTSMGELAASIAHEINQPISAILSNLDSLEVILDSREPDMRELRAILDDIRGDDLRASEIVRHIRDLARRREPHIETFDVNELVRSALRVIAPVARRRGVTVRASYGDIPPVLGDHIHVQQVLLNLAFNAMDAMGETPRDARVLEVSTSRAGPMAQIAVRDNGHGIAPEHVGKIFESFFTTKSDGLGLGLSIARSLVRAQGGRIRAENNADGGATVSFTLPAQAAARSG